MENKDVSRLWVQQKWFSLHTFCSSLLGWAHTVTALTTLYLRTSTSVKLQAWPSLALATETACPVGPVCATTPRSLRGPTVSTTRHSVNDLEASSVTVRHRCMMSPSLPTLPHKAGNQLNGLTVELHTFTIASSVLSVKSSVRWSWWIMLDLKRHFHFTTIAPIIPTHLFSYLLERGSCIMGKCACSEGWEGDACECPKSNQTCLDSKGVSRADRHCVDEVIIRLSCQPVSLWRIMFVSKPGRLQRTREMCMRPLWVSILHFWADFNLWAEFPGVCWSNYNLRRA